VEVGRPLGQPVRHYSGGPIETIAVQRFDAPLDLSHCAELVVTLRTSEPFCTCSMELSSGEGMVDGVRTLGMKAAGGRVAGVSGARRTRSKRVSAHPESSQNEAGEPHKNTQVELEAFTLVSPVLVSR